MNILENYKETLNISNKKIKKHRSINENSEASNTGSNNSGSMKVVSNTGLNQQQNDEIGNHHINNFLKANKEQKNKDVMSQVERVENGIDRMHKVIEKLRKIIHELKHTYFQNEYPSASSNYDGKNHKN